MQMTELFLAELDREVERSRRALENVPEGKQMCPEGHIILAGVRAKLNMKQHMQYACHLGHKFYCGVCGRGYITYSNLKDHEGVHDGE